jgi:phage baseplate assembly protein W
MATPRYKDIDMDFKAHPTTGDAPIKEDIEAVKRSVRGLVLTSRHERPFQPQINSGIRHLLFEPLSPITAFQIRQNIINVLNQFEPRAELLEVQVIAQEEHNAFLVTIYFRVVNIPEPAMVNLTLERLR